MSGCYQIDSPFKSEFFEFCWDCFKSGENKYKYTCEISCFQREQNRELIQLKYIEEDRKKERLEMKRVMFHPSIVTEYIESVWQSKEELDDYREELNLQYPDISIEERHERRNENNRKTRQRFLNNKSYDKLFMDYPSGLCYLPSYVNCTCDLGYEAYVIKNKITLELSTAPPVFTHIHPFDENLTFYFNSYLQRSMAIRPINRQNIRDGKLLSTTDLEREVFCMPFELERRLWVYRIAQFRDWKLSFSKNSTNLPTNDEAVGICKYSYSYDRKTYPSRRIEDPMKYFKC